MGEEAQKRNTDCVYFLASPLTCKKGGDCEYRHSEAARVNPRDCWYWLSGNCLNVNCSFRHPPLDGRPGAGPCSSTGGNAAASVSGIVVSSSSSAVQPQPPLPTSKSTVPCFFFSQGFCSKGSKCGFLHGPPPTHFRKEAMTYRKPPEQPAAAEGNGLSSARAQVQESKQRPLVHSPVKASSFTPSNVYKLSFHGGGGPPNFSTPSGKQSTQKTSQADKVEFMHGGIENSRQGQSVGGRVSQVQIRDENLEQERVAARGQVLELDLSRGLHRQVRPSSTIHNARISEGVFSSEMQEWASEEEDLVTRELDVRDLRNHLKRKRNDTIFTPNVNGREQYKDRLESGHLASRAVVVGGFKDSVSSSSTSKRVMQDKEASTFSGPKSLAQIKAEKSKTIDALENSRGQAGSSGDDMVAEVKREQSLPELCDNSTFKAFENGKQNLVDMPFTKEHTALGLVVRNKEDSSSPRESKGYGRRPVAPSPSELVPIREAGSWLDEQLTANVVGSKAVSDAGINFHPGMDTSEGNGMEFGYYISADDGAEALENTMEAEYLSDYQEDDFTKKLSSFA